MLLLLALKARAQPFNMCGQRCATAVDLGWNIFPAKTSGCTDVQQIVGVRVGICFKPSCAIRSFVSEDGKCAGVCELVMINLTHRTLPLANLITALSSSF